MMAFLIFSLFCQGRGYLSNMFSLLLQGQTCICISKLLAKLNKRNCYLSRSLKWNLPLFRHPWVSLGIFRKACERERKEHGWTCRLGGFRLLPLQALWPWASYLISFVSLSFLYQSMGFNGHLRRVVTSNFDNSSRACHTYKCFGCSHSFEMQLCVDFAFYHT